MPPARLPLGTETLVLHGLKYYEAAFNARIGWEQFELRFTQVSDDNAKALEYITDSNTVPTPIKVGDTLSFKIGTRLTVRPRTKLCP
jgi:hypothetical protein